MYCLAECSKLWEVSERAEAKGYPFTHLPMAIREVNYSVQNRDLLYGIKYLLQNVVPTDFPKWLFIQAFQGYLKGYQREDTSSAFSQPCDVPLDRRNRDSHSKFCPQLFYLNEIFRIKKRYRGRGASRGISTNREVSRVNEGESRYSFKEQKPVYSYPRRNNCERNDSVCIFYPLSAWFIFPRDTFTQVYEFAALIQTSQQLLASHLLRCFCIMF